MGAQTPVMGRSAYPISVLVLTKMFLPYAVPQHPQPLACRRLDDMPQQKGSLGPTLGLVGKRLSRKQAFKVEVTTSAG